MLRVEYATQELNKTVFVAWKLVLFSGICKVWIGFEQFIRKTEYKYKYKYKYIMY